MTTPTTTVRLLVFGLVSWKALLAIQGCGGGGGYGSKGGKGEVNANPPKAPGPCECIGNDAFKDSGKMFKKFPEDTGKWCSQWDKEYNRRCADTDEERDDWKPEWCDKIYCLVPKDCELDDVAKHYDGNFADEFGMDGMWSSKNCDASLFPKVETTASPTGAQTTASP
jgi:hypothetical protein